LHPVCLTLWASIAGKLSPGDDRITAAHPRQVFWLPDLPTACAFPSRWIGTVAHPQVSSPVTAAGPLPSCTGFPIKPRWGHLDLSYARSCDECQPYTSVSANIFCAGILGVFTVCRTDPGEDFKAGERAAVCRGSNAAARF
jgi:hypothetical protein